jgi:polyhydroxyalkanoate synthase
LAPRPLPAHLMSACGLWLSSRIALPLLRPGLPPWNRPGRRLLALAEEIDACGRERVAAALDREIIGRVAAFIGGLEAYRRHPYRRVAGRRPVRWQEGGSRLIDYGGAGPAVVVVPSLVNRYYVLDLLPEHSFLRHLARLGLNPLVVDWGEPGAAELGFGLDAYVARLGRALTAAAARGPVAVVGYCMGGLLALAAALPRQAAISAVTLLATPWDFHARAALQAGALGAVGGGLDGLERVLFPVEAIQSLFFAIDPFLAQRKFARFATLDPQGDAARRFVALEDWINDGVPLPIAVARECLVAWYGRNQPARGAWRVAGRPVQPQALRRPALVVIPGHDRIVPPASAAALAAALPDAEMLRPPLGHVGMMTAARAAEMVWTPLARWLMAAAARGAG